MAATLLQILPEQIIRTSLSESTSGSHCLSRANKLVRERDWDQIRDYIHHAYGLFKRSPSGKCYHSVQCRNARVSRSFFPYSHQTAYLPTHTRTHTLQLSISVKLTFVILWCAIFTSLSSSSLLNSSVLSVMSICFLSFHNGCNYVQLLLYGLSDNKLTLPLHTCMTPLYSSCTKDTKKSPDSW